MCPQMNSRWQSLSMSQTGPQRISPDTGRRLYRGSILLRITSPLPPPVPLPPPFVDENACTEDGIEQQLLWCCQSGTVYNYTLQSKAVEIRTPSSEATYNSHVFLWQAFSRRNTCFLLLFLFPAEARVLWGSEEVVFRMRKMGVAFLCVGFVRRLDYRFCSRFSLVWS